MFESTAHQSLFKAKSCTTRFGIIFTRKAKTIYMSINILLKFILSTSVQCSTTEGFQFNLWPLQTSLLPLRAMVSCISRTRDFWLKISAKRCGLYTSFYGNIFSRWLEVGQVHHSHLFFGVICIILREFFGKILIVWSI